MPRWLLSLIVVDISALVLPTGRLPYALQFWLALSLAALTGLAGLYLFLSEHIRE